MKKNKKNLKNSLKKNLKQSLNKTFIKSFAKVLSVLLIVLLFSCSAEVPVFAIKRFSDESYRKVTSNFEMGSKEEVHWSFVFKKIKKQKNFRIFVLANQLSWVDVLIQTDYIDIEKPAIHGVISDLPPGDYKIVLVNLKKAQDVLFEQEFLVYEDAD